MANKVFGPGSTLYCNIAGDLVVVQYKEVSYRRGRFLVARQDRPVGSQEVAVKGDDCFDTEMAAIKATMQYCETNMKKHQQSLARLNRKYQKLMDRETELEEGSKTMLGYPPESVICFNCIHWGQTSAPALGLAGKGICALAGSPGNIGSNSSCLNWKPNRYVATTVRADEPTVMGLKSPAEAQSCSECYGKGTDCHGCSNYR